MINVIPYGLEKYMSFTITKQLSFIESCQFLSSSLDSLVRNLCKDDFNYLSQEFDKQIGFYPYKYLSDFEKFKEEFPSKEKFCSLLSDKKITDKEYERVLNIWKTLKIKL